jgi:hypothetical protein
MSCGCSHARASRGDIIAEGKKLVAASPGTSSSTLIVWFRSAGTEHVVAEMDSTTSRLTRILITTNQADCAQALYEYERERLRQAKQQDKERRGGARFVFGPLAKMAAHSLATNRSRHTYGPLSGRSLAKERPETREHKAARLRREAQHARERGRPELAEYLERQAEHVRATRSGSSEKPVTYRGHTITLALEDDNDSAAYISKIGDSEGRMPEFGLSRAREDPLYRRHGPRRWLSFGF